jgi:DNA modification methylase
LTEWGFSDEELFGDGIFDEPEAEEDDYEVPDEIETDIVLGDLIEIGEHRLLCGDSTDSDSVAKLMDGEKADMVFTDPPYDLEDISFTDDLFIFTDGHIFILNTTKRNVAISTKHEEFLTRWYAVDFRQAHLINNNAPMDRVDFVVEFRTSEKVKFNNLKKGFTTLIECAKIHNKKGETIHKQEKKVQLPAVFIEHFSNIDEICLDIFLGSGSTMVAAHQLKRKCYGMELDSKYCQIIVDRMIALDSTLEIKVNGKPYMQEVA